MNAQQTYQTMWLSDIHLGSKDCKAEFLLHCLSQVKVKKLYLVGDIVDCWALKHRLFWPESHQRVLNRFFELAQQGTEVVYLPGNHDQLVKQYHCFDVAGIRITEQDTHTTLDGRQLLVLHGDQFDGQVCFGRWHAKIGDVLYDLLLFLNRQLHKGRTALGLPYWSLASYLKSKVAKANEAIDRYRAAGINEARQLKLDGIVCGHIHHPQLSEQDGLIYCNDGDWIENCTTLLEDKNGKLALMGWCDAQNRLTVISQESATFESNVQSQAA